jgi:ketosteroid isomerase-like protein
MPADSPQACTAAFTAALIDRDIDAALALLSDDVVFFYSNGTAIRRKQDFASMMTSSWKTIEGYKYATLDATWVAQSDAAAAVIYRFAWSGAVRGQDVGGRGRATRVLCREPGSGWLIAHEHLSAGDWGVGLP